jgi:hypothetical protein
VKWFTVVLAALLIVGCSRPRKIQAPSQIHYSSGENGKFFPKITPRSVSDLAVGETGRVRVWFAEDGTPFIFFDSELEENAPDYIPYVTRGSVGNRYIVKIPVAWATKDYFQVWRLATAPKDAIIPDVFPPTENLQPPTTSTNLK